MHDPLKALADLGIPIDKLGDAERNALSTLTPDELEAITRIHKRVVGEIDVQGYAAPSETACVIIY